ncbi:MAG: hypothetical protein KGI73_03920 [Patescibacteria group bacterium]|nr:hypothetical protein [Patescibacteria group bacterium]
MFQELSRLFENPRRIKILKFFIFQPDQRFAAVDFSAIGVPKAAAEKELRALTRAGIIMPRKLRAQVTYALNPRHQLISALRDFLDTVTLPDNRALLECFKGVPGLSLIVATGVLAREERSSADLLIVARKPQHPAIAKAVFKVECAIGLPLRYAVMETHRYTERLEAHDRLLRDVFEFQHRVILGRL